MASKWEVKWFHFDDGANPYGVYGDRFDEFFKMICAWNPRITGEDSLRCPKVPTEAYYHGTDREFKKNALRRFATHYNEMRNLDLYTPILDERAITWYTEFFSVYGKKLGLLREFHEMGVC